jgi:hypothetical protein
MASAWQQNYVVQKLNNKFKDKQTTEATARDFQNKHGPKGKGAAGKKPYKFGNFAGFDSAVINTRDQAKWLIDTGTRNWDSTLAQMEETIRKNLADDGDQVPMNFSITPDGGNKAHVEIIEKRDAAGKLVSYDIKIHCRT